MTSGETAVPGQPKFASVWWVANEWQRSLGWNPAPKESSHPVAVSESGPVKRMRLRPVVQAVPRTTDPRSASEASLHPVPTPAGDPVGCAKDGTFLCRYRLPLLREAYRGFVNEVFAGDLSEASTLAFREALLLSSYV